MRTLRYRYHTRNRCLHLQAFKKPVSKWHLLKGTHGSVLTMVAFSILVIFVGHGYADANNKAVEASFYQQTASSESVQVAQVTSQNEEMKAELESYKTKYPNPTQQQIEDYMKLIFGSDFRVARAISHNECGPTNKDYPACEWHTNIEDSVGLFQINLYNSKQWIHAGRIPGTTMSEKIAWLKNPFNNTLYAYWVFKTSGWNPWSTFSDGRYKNSL